ncbi:nacht nucleoside triphosphatase [Metarhizium guizhouense ARSEF 977]|uniref:Nacht nucleoside triphosphatase n=1 Tax=Metarhizium guizhouense (strain ARSEF 977) TaxID=1276136 RepID=A0A0B4GYI9_METGA|nr:nacht nucleoside triphosphatase [Metarhizium guizhouense ARSEF 977]
MASRKDGRLIQIHPSPDSNIETDIDIIAIHGLETKAPETWTWRDRRHPKNNVNWLEQEDMLPHEVGNAQIFVCNWEAELFQKSIPTNLEESARSFLRIMAQHLKQEEGGAGTKPILFIASCFGGIILMKALEIDKNTCQEKTLVKATRGIIFLATPFKGTSFKEVPDASLKFMALFRDRKLTELIDYVNEPKSNANELLKRFNDIKSEERYEIFTFWEAEGMSLLGKFKMDFLFSERMFLLLAASLILLPIVAFASPPTHPFSTSWLSMFPWLLVVFLCWLFGFYFYRPKQLVDENSATAGWAFEGQRLNRIHTRMNKFSDPECPDYMRVSGEIRRLLNNIRKEETPLDRVDKQIIEQYRSEKGRRLSVERLSGQRLPMEKCYINLAIIEKGSNGSDTPNDGHVPSLSARQKVETPAQNLQIELSTIFNQRQEPNNFILPRRILIRGRAGVGKTTLCKKIVHEFINGSWSEWRNLFQRVLWVPLRNLKGRRDMDGYSMKALLNREYFSSDSNLDSAGTLLNAAAAESNKTLFVLDGLDEVSNFLAGDDELGKTLRWLLNRPNVIITARPSVSFPQELQRLDLELETIGFYPEQVDEYIHMAFTDPRKEGNKGNPSNTVKNIQRFLQKHRLIQSLIRIPILLDAFCLIWNDSIDGDVLNNMSGLYQAIELNLWRKDVERLGKNHDDQPISAEQIRRAIRREIEKFIGNELLFLECLAFTGLYHDEIHFTRQQLGCISVELGGKLMLDKTLPLLSFLRTPGHSTDPEDHSYHFLHLTFQEYFAARYFVRKWKEGKGPLQVLTLDTENGTQILPAVFLRKHKYTSRYDIFWRFVAGLIDADGQAQQFIDMVEEEPLDLLGPTHQRLVMHCLSEISSDFQGRTIRNTSKVDFRDTRKRLEERLGNWLIFELEFAKGTSLGIKAETPVHVRREILLKGSPNIRRSFWMLHPYGYGQTSPEDVLWEAAEIVENPTENEDLRHYTINVLTRQNSLPDGLIDKFTAWITDPDRDSRIRDVVIEVFRRLSRWPGRIQRLARQLLNLHEMKEAANRIMSISKQLSLPDELQHEVETWWFTKGKRSIQNAAMDISRELEWPDNILQILILLLKNENVGIRTATIEALNSPAKLPSTTLQAISLRLRDEAAEVRRTAIHTLDKQSDLADNILQEMASRLCDEEVLVREAATIALAVRPNLTDDIIQRLEALFVQETARFRLQVMQKLPGGRRYSDRILLMVATQLTNTGEHAMQTAAHFRQICPRIPEQIQRTIVAGARSGSAKVREAAISTLRFQAVLSREAEQLIAEGLTDANIEIRDVAYLSTQSLYVMKISNLSDEFIQLLADLIMDENLSQNRLLQILNVLSLRDHLTPDLLDTIAASLACTDWRIRRNASKCLALEDNLPERILKAVAERLEDEHDGVRATSLEILIKNKKIGQLLPAALLQLAKWNKNSRHEIISRFTIFAKLPNELLQVLLCWLEDDFEPAWYETEFLLRRHEEFYNTILSGPKAILLYEVLLRRSFAYQISLYVEDGYLCVNTPEGIRKGRIDNTQCDIVAEIKKKRPPNYPLPDNR